ncbi:9291_t:CDS:2 [Paraglomus brasilianum]|uniref:9291_t:CDS:1 n=1 Tax=Paraglomus brasilianum TaxID=144538 RepID=A0A9N8VP12_9GLOM|nr:9291_t:CDS:2 [Paraglomus brasilianum]
MQSQFSTFDTSTLIVLPGLIVGLYVFRFYYKYFTRENPLPGPFPLPLIGNLYQFTGGDFSLWINSFHKKYGDMFEIYMASERQIWLNRADQLDSVMSASTKTAFPVRFSPSEGLDEFDISRNSVAFNSDLNAWRFYRKFLDRTLTPKTYKEAIVVTEKRFKELTEHWDKFGYDNVIDSPAWIRRCIGDVVMLMTLGKNPYLMAKYFSSLRPSEKVETHHDLLEETEKLIESVHNFFYGAQFFLFFPRFIRNSVFRFYAKKLHASYNWSKQLIYGIIRERRQVIENTPNNVPLKPDLMNMLITTNTKRDVNGKFRSEWKDPMTDEEIRVVLWEFIIGAIETTPPTFGFVIDRIEREPQVKERMIAEIDAHFAEDPDRSITYNDLSELVYCDAVVNEALRLHPPGPLNFRYNHRDEEVGGYTWKAGTQFGINFRAVHTCTAHWEDPDKFFPERFLISNVEKNSFLPFGSGMRMCPGKNMALTIIKTLLVSFYRKYNVRLANPDSPLKFTFRLVNACEGAQVCIEPRN